MLCCSLRQLIHELSVSINIHFCTSFVVLYLLAFRLFHIIFSVQCHHFYPLKSKKEWISLGKRRKNILPVLPCLLSIYVVPSKLYSVSSICYIFQSHCILPVLSIYLCAMDAGMCNITWRKRSWPTVIEVHRWASTMQQSSASFPLAATLMKLCVMIILCYLELQDLSYWEF